MNFRMMKWRLQGAVRSMTIWVNSVFGAVVLGLPELQSAFPQMQPYVPDQFFKYAMGAVIAANIALRFKTNKDLAAK